MPKLLKFILILLICLIASLSLLSDDFVKFLLSGQSATVNVILIRHHYLFVFALALLPIFSIVYMRSTKSGWLCLFLSWVIFIFSLQSYALDKNAKDAVLISGIGIFPVQKCVLTESNNCASGFSFFLGDEVVQAIHSLNRSGSIIYEDLNYVVVERLSESDSICYYYSSITNKLLSVEENIDGRQERFWMDQEYQDPKLKNRAGDYIYKSYFHMYPGFKMIYQDEVENVIKTGDSRFELFLDSMMQTDLGVKLTAFEKQNVFYYISQY